MIKLPDRYGRRSIWVGFDPREAAAFAVARSSIRRRLTTPIPIFGIVLSDVQGRGLYERPTDCRVTGDQRVLWDVISDAPMSTEFACSRFLTPMLAGHDGWALFCDCDVLARANLSELFDLADPTKAVMCVKHDHVPDAATKMDGQPQTAYGRKNWSSVMLFNCDHPANVRRLTYDLVNTVPGRDLHRFCWLNDDEIGELGPEWNYLVGETQADVEPKLVHFTLGGPWFSRYEDVPYADEWRAELAAWAAQ
jgi:lipopolysaccharide biosynthesis glycosyltransferase